jgi:hypothetical protein
MRLNQVPKNKLFDQTPKKKELRLNQAQLKSCASAKSQKTSYSTQRPKKVLRLLTI